MLYARAAIGVIQPLLMTRRRRSLTAEVFDTDGPLRVVKFRFTPGTPNADEPRIVRGEQLASVLDRIAASLDEALSAQLYTRRHLRLYAGETFYIVKPAQRRFWSRSAAMADADSVLGDLMGTRDGRAR